MKILLDENVPKQLLEPLDLALGDHVVHHVDDLGWKRKKDLILFRDARIRSFNVIVTNDKGQLADEDERKALRNAGLHYVGYPDAPRNSGRGGWARVLGSVLGAMPYVIAYLEQADELQRVEISVMDASRFTPTRL
ncbi:MAG TPA: hypothetical protein VHE83_03695 [Mycobacteriales bacterium]|nr:hypothetical protein [Mycobacteriales bacterium]